MPSPNKTADVRSPSTPSEKARAKTSNPASGSTTPNLKSKSQPSVPSSRKQSLDKKSKTKTSDSKSETKPLDTVNSKGENDVHNDEGEDVTSDEDSPEDHTFHTEPSDEDGKMNTAVLIRPDTADAATDTNEDKSGTDDECDTSGSEQSTRYSRSPCRSEMRFPRCESAGNPRSDAKRILNRYCCEYLQPSMSFDRRFEGPSRLTDTYCDVVRPFRYCGYSAKPDYCSRRF